MGYIIVTHTDMDGVGSAAVYTYLAGEKPERVIYTEPYLLAEAFSVLRRAGAEKIAFMDLGMNPGVFEAAKRFAEEMARRGVRIEWYDHHVWSDEWIRGIRESGVDIHVDRSTCATGVVAKYAPRRRESVDEDFLREVVGGVCAGDIWRFDHWRGPWYLRLVRRRDSDEWRNHVLETISSGKAWIDEFTEKVKERFEEELRALSIVEKKIKVYRADGVRIAVIPWTRGVEASFSAALALGRTGAEIAAVVSRDGKISLRSTGYNVRDIALILGGGGHPRAAGARVHIPVIRRLVCVFTPKPCIEYAVGKLIEAVARHRGRGPS